MSLDNLAPLGAPIETDYQTIRFYEYEESQLVFTLDTFIQFVEGEDEQNYHDVITRPAFEMCPLAQEVLILGGGDGLVARNLFKLNPLVQITQIELDPKVTEIFSSWDRLVELNEGSLDNVWLIHDDAMSWVDSLRYQSRIQYPLWDIVICDFPDPNNEELKKLFSKEYIKKFSDLLYKDGVIVIQCHFDIADEISEIVQSLLGNCKRIEYEMPYLDGGEIILGRKQ